MTTERYLQCDGKKRRVDWGTGADSKPALGVLSVPYDTVTGRGQIIVDIAQADPRALRTNYHVTPFTRSMTIHEDDKEPEHFAVEWLESRRQGNMMKHDVRILTRPVSALSAGNN